MGGLHCFGIDSYPRLIGGRFNSNFIKKIGQRLHMPDAGVWRAPVGNLLQRLVRDAGFARYARQRHHPGVEFRHDVVIDVFAHGADYVPHSDTMQIHIFPAHRAKVGT